MSTQDFKLTFGVDIAELVTGMTEATEAVVEASAKMKESLLTVSETFAKIGEASVTLTAILAGGGAFKEMVESSVNLTKESVALGRQMGISATEASVLKVAMDSVFITQDQLSNAGAKLTQAIAKHPELFKQMGIEIHGANGALLPMAEIITNVNAHLAQFTEGTSRNVEASRIAGKGWRDLIDVQRLTPAVVDEAREKAEALGLVVGVESVAQTKAYRLAMVELHDVFEGSFKVIGDAVIPQLTLLADWFVTNGPNIVNIFRASVEALQVVVTSLAQSVHAALSLLIELASGLGGAIKDAFVVLGSVVSSVASAISSAFSIMGSITTEITSIYVAMGSAVVDVFTSMKEIIDEFAASLASAFSIAEGVVATFSDSFGTVSSVIKDSFTEVSSAIGEVTDVIKATFASLGSALSAVTGAFAEAGSAIKDLFAGVADTLSSFMSTVSEFGSEVSESIKGAFSGPPLTAMEFFKNALKVVEVAFIGLRSVIQVSVEIIAGGLEQLNDVVLLWSHVAQKAFEMDWDGVSAAWNAGTAKIEQDLYAHAQKIVAISAKGAKDANDAIMDEIGKAPVVTEIKPPAEGKTAQEGPAKDILKQYELQLEQAKLSYEQQSIAQGQFQQLSLADELKFWEEKRSLHQTNADQTLEIDKKIATTELQLNKQAYEAQMGALKQQETAAGKSAAAKIAIVEQEVAAEAAAYGKLSPQYEAAQKHLVEVQQQAQDQLRQMADAFSKLEADREIKALDDDDKILQEKFKDHQINADQLAQQEIALEDKRTEIARKGIEDRRALIDPTHDPVEYAQLTAQLENLEMQYQDKVTQIQKQAEQNRRTLFNQEYKTMEDGFSTAIENMVKKTQTFQQAMQSLFKTIIDSLIKMLAQWAVEWAATQIKNLLLSKTTAAGQVQAQAGVAGAAMTASAAEAPYPLDLGAPAEGAAAYAAAMGFQASVGAATGWDVPANMSDIPVAQLHPKEMVLPANLAEGIRSMIESGQRGGATSINIQANDARSFDRMVTRNPATFQKVMKMAQARAYR